MSPGVVYNPFPQEILEFLSRYHAHGLPGEACVTCNSACCSQGGFGLLENVELIYDIYRAGGLRRDDYTFSPGMSLGEFMFTFFDVRSYLISGRDTVFFHMRNLDANGNIISMPDDGRSYWEARYEFFRDNPGLNRGCVFLSAMVSAEGDNNSERGCILHVPESPDHLTAKPIDCLLFSCAERPGIYRKPSPDDTRQWFELLATHYQGSVDRLKAMLVDGGRRG